MPRDAVVLLSGGMDSATTAAIAHEQGFVIHALSFRYGQRHVVELEAARRVGEQLGVARHVVLDIDLRAFGGSALTDAIDSHDPEGPIALSGPVNVIAAENCHECFGR